MGHFGKIWRADPVFSSYGPTLLKLVYYCWILTQWLNQGMSDLHIDHSSYKRTDTDLIDYNSDTDSDERNADFI